jgi:cytoskeleton protein RodZ
MSSTPFGEHLKREREMRGVSLEEIAAATRISTRFLEALESGQWDQLPGGAFNRGFIRSTARFLGLNEDSMVAEYAQETKGQTESKAFDGSVAPMPRDFRPLGVLLGVLFVLVVALAYGLHRYHIARLRSQAAAVAAVAPPAPVSPVPEIASPVAPPATATPPAAGDTTASATTLPNVAPDLTKTPTTADPVPADTSKANAPAAASSVPDILKLKVEDGKSARIKVVADGKKLFDGRLRARTEKRFQARNGFEITSSESSSLSLELNGQSVPILTGPPGQPISITRKDLKASNGNR